MSNLRQDKTVMDLSLNHITTVVYMQRGGLFTRSYKAKTNATRIVGNPSLIKSSNMVTLYKDVLFIKEAVFIWDEIKENESEVENFCFVFSHFLLGKSFNFVKTSWWLGYWFLRNSILNDCKNNKTTKKLSALFGYILKSIFASSNSF